MIVNVIIKIKKERKEDPAVYPGHQQLTLKIKEKKLNVYSVFPVWSIFQGY